MPGRFLSCTFSFINPMHNPCDNQCRQLQVYWTIRVMGRGGCWFVCLVSPQYPCGMFRAFSGRSVTSGYAKVRVVQDVLWSETAFPPESRLRERRPHYSTHLQVLSDGFKTSCKIQLGKAEKQSSPWMGMNFTPYTWG